MPISASGPTTLPGRRWLIGPTWAPSPTSDSSTQEPYTCARAAIRLSRTRLLAVARKEVVQLRRDRRSLILAFLLPVFMLVMFGYAISWDVRDIHMVVVDQDRTVKSRDLVDAFAASGYFKIVDQVVAMARKNKAAK